MYRYAATAEAINRLEGGSGNPRIDYLKKKRMLVHCGYSEDEIGEKMFRTSGECVCKECGKPYRKHPFIDDVLSDGQPWLHLLCDGTLAKL